MVEAAADLSALTDDFGFDSNRHNGGLVNEWGTTASSLQTMRELKRSGAKGPEAASIFRELRVIQNLAEVKRDMNAWLVRLTNLSTRHPYSERIFDTFKMLRARCQDEEQLHQLQSFLSQRNRIVRFSFGSNARAAMVACIYAIFQTEDVHMQDATRERCYSLPMVGHVAGVPLKRARKWLRALRILCSDVFAGVKADAPIFYVDDIVAALSQPDTQAAHLTPSQRRVLAAVDMQEVRLTARKLCRQVLQSPSFTADNAIYAGHSGISMAEWAFYAVLWAMGGQLGQTLKGKDWVKTDLLVRILNQDDQNHNVESSSAIDSHVAAYHSVGHAIAHRASCIPWVNPTSGRRRKKARLEDDGESLRPAIKDDQIHKHVKAVADLGPSLEERYHQQWLAEQEQQRKTSPVPPPLSLVTCPPPSPSDTSQHHPHLSTNPILLDTLSDAEIDSTLFTPDEMATYLRTDEEVHLIRDAKGQEWDEAERQQQTAAAKSNKSRVHHGGTETQRYLTYTPPSGGRPRKTKASERLLAYARGEFPDEDQEEVDDDDTAGDEEDDDVFGFCQLDEDDVNSDSDSASGNDSEG